MRQLNLLELQEVVIKRLLADTDLFGCDFECNSMFAVELPPLANFDDHFTNLPFLFAPRSFASFGLSSDESVSVVTTSTFSELEDDLLSLITQKIRDVFNHIISIFDARIPG